ncbi:MAG: 50S ribosomal protein L10 [Candidatus Aenigmarchaeota archaeon]|nr:50S ribosomal protein L10 [Candidatus Aenigmarchaeota archaeon]
MSANTIAKRKGRGEPNPEKLKSVAVIQGELKKYPVIGLVNMHKMPAAQLQEMRLKLEGKARILTAKKAVFQHAIDGVGGTIKALDEPLVKPHVQPALVFSELNPFVLFKFIEQNKSEAPAKAGDIAPKDILVKAGDTGMPPGPAIGTFSTAGLKAKVVGGKIHIMEDKIVTKSGEAVRPEVVNVLNMLSIKPMEIGLDVIGVYEDGLVYGKDVLRIDDKEFAQRLTNAITGAINLSVNSGYITKQTADIAVAKAYREAREVAFASGAYEKGVIEELLAKHVLEYAALKSQTADTPQVKSEENKN